MKVLILGGNSSSNRPWALALAKQLELAGIPAYVHMYQHWDSGVPFIDIEHELQALQEQAALAGTYGIIAKSMGSLLALRGIYENVLVPTTCIFLGFPLAIVQEMSLPATAWLSMLRQKVCFIQNDQDPLGSAEAVAAYLKTAYPRKAPLVTWPNATHEYRDFAEIATIFSSTAARQGHH